MAVTETEATTTLSALRLSRPRAVTLLGQVDENQGRMTFTGRMTLDQYCDLTVVHNRKWAENAGASMDMVTQREIIDPHATGLALFILQGLVETTIQHAEAGESDLTEGVLAALHRIQDRIGETAHYGLPQATLVMQDMPSFKHIKDEDGAAIASRLVMPAGGFFNVADGQHRREAARRVREFLHSSIGSRRTPKGAKFYPAEDAPLSSDEVEAWIAVQETFRASTVIAYEAHLQLSVEEARQLFTNYNCHVKPVKAETNLEFDQSNPINRFAKEWLKPILAGRGDSELDLRQLGSINGFLFLGKTSIKQAPYDIANVLIHAKKFWNLITETAEWSREGSILREVPVLKGLAKAWFMVYLARRNSKSAKAAHLFNFIQITTFDTAWMESVPGLKEHTVATPDGGWRFSPAHNDIVGAIQRHVVGA
jgi:hypothetical protein